jgi:hypothetical protein
MRARIAFLPVLLLSMVFAARAQDVDIFGGYSYLGNTAPTNSVQTSANGWNAAVAANYKLWGAVADFSGHPYSASPAATPLTGSGGSGTMFLFGPQYSVRRIPRVTPFVHALFGVVQGSTVGGGATPAICPVEGSCQGSGYIIAPATAFAMAFGGGLDVKVSKHVRIRVFQVDYVRQDFGKAFAGGSVNAPRISAGIVFHTGKL